jgi:hypothetical protein
MATTTTNYGFDIPQSTDLVKDGATAIATLGQDIDTAMNTALGTKKAGMVLLNTTSFSGAVSFSLPADTFTAAYENYKILVKLTDSPSVALNVRLRASGADNTSALYNQQLLSLFGTTVSTSRSVTQTSWDIGNGDDLNVIDMTLYAPFLSERTGGIFQVGRQVQGAGIEGYQAYVGHNSTTSFDSLTFFQSSNIQGKVSVYGFNF